MKAGILTFYYANNYGAALQVYSLQRVLEKLGADTVVINYANRYQLDFDSLYPVRSGVKRLIKRLLMLPDHRERLSRVNKFADYRNMYLNLTDYCNSAGEFETETSKLDMCVVGSDQVWNSTKGFEFDDIYFLGSVSSRCKKVAYAASIGNANIEDLKPYRSLISTFDYISMREDRGKKVVENLIGRNVLKVLDPTLVVNSEDFRSIKKQYKLPVGRYLLYYSLDGFDKRRRNVDLLCKASEHFGMPVVAICPEWKKYNNHIINVIDAGPEEFLWLIDNASYVFTNSFHGTALSLSLEKQFFVLEEYDGKDDRKISILKELGIDDRISNQWDEIEKKLNSKIDYTKVKETLNKKRKLSLDFLMSAMGGCR